METGDTKKSGGDFAALTALVRGQRYTLLVMSGFGIGATAMQITLEDIRVSAYAQYPESVQVIFKQKGKRALQGMRFHGSTSVAVWNGWQDIATNAFTAPTISNGFVCRSGRYLSFDSRYLTDAVASATALPIFAKIQ